MARPWEKYTEVIPEIVRPWEKYDVPATEAPAVQLNAPSDEVIKAVPRSHLAFKPSGEALTPGQRTQQAPRLTEIAEDVLSVVEPVATVATGAIAEPLAGVGGIAKTITSGAAEGAKTVAAIREGLTFQPKTAAGQRGLQAVGEAVTETKIPFTDMSIPEALQESEKFLGDELFKITGSPSAAAIGATIPTAVLEAIGFGMGKAIKGAGKLRAKVRDKKLIRQSIVEAAPDIEKIEDASRVLYTELADSGVKIRPKAYNAFSNKLRKKMNAEGLDKELTPKSATVIRRVISTKSKAPTLKDIEKIRKFAKNAASSVDTSDARLGKMLIDEIDNFVGNTDVISFKSGFDDPVHGAGFGGIGPKYEAARALWGRAKRAELLNKAFEDASRASSGFEKGIENNFRSLLKNKNNKKFFSKKEIVAMDDVINGPKALSTHNIAKTIGKLGYHGGGLDIIKAGVGYGVGGPLGVAAPAAGFLGEYISKQLAKGKTKFVDAIVRAGDDADAITALYIRNTPKAARSTGELSDLLLKTDLNAAKTSLWDKQGFLLESAEIARGKKVLEAAKPVALAAPGAIQTQRQEEPRATLRLGLSPE